MSEERKWIQSEPGILALVGTPMRIVYKQSSNGDFLIMQGDRALYHCWTLGQAKEEAGWRLRSLEEIGMI